MKTAVAPHWELIECFFYSVFFSSLCLPSAKTYVGENLYFTSPFRDKTNS